MRIQQDQSWIFGDGYWRREIFHGYRQTQGNLRMAYPNNCYTSLKILRLWKLLPTIYLAFLWTCKTTKQSVEERSEIWVDRWLSTSIWRTKETIHRRTCPYNARSIKTIPNWNRCIQICNRSGSYSTGLKWQQTPISFISKTLSPAERNYEIYDRELLAIIRALKEWRHYIQGSPHTTIVLSDHKNLTYYREAKKLNRRQAQWSLYLSEFDVKLVHTLGSKMVQSDA